MYSRRYEKTVSKLTHPGHRALAAGLLLLLGAALALLASGCGSGASLGEDLTPSASGQTQAVTPGPSGSATPLPELVSALPGVDKLAALPEPDHNTVLAALNTKADRQVSSSPNTVQVEAFNSLAHSPDYFIDGSQKGIMAPQQGLSWALFRLSPGTVRPNSLQIIGNISGQGAWVLLPDFKASRWQSYGTYTDFNSSVIALDTSRNFDSANQMYFAVLCLPGSSVTLDSAQIHFINPAAREHEVLPAVGNSAALRLLYVDSHPALIYRDAASQSLMCAMSTRSYPQKAEDWAISTIDALGDPGANLDALLIDGRLTVFYERASDNKLRVAQADVAWPSADSQWQSVALDVNHEVLGLDAEIVNGHVCVATYQTDAADSDGDNIFAYLRYYRGLDASPLGSYNTTRIANLSAIPTHPVLGEKQGLAFVVFTDLFDGELSIMYTDFLAPDNPDNWIRNNTQIPCENDHFSLSERDGNPVIAYCSPGGSNHIIETEGGYSSDGSGWGNYTLSSTSGANCSGFAAGNCLGWIFDEKPINQTRITWHLGYLPFPDPQSDTYVEGSLNLDAPCAALSCSNERWRFSVAWINSSSGALSFADLY